MRWPNYEKDPEPAPDERFRRCEKCQRGRAGQRVHGQVSVGSDVRDFRKIGKISNDVAATSAAGVGTVAAGVAGSLGMALGAHVAYEVRKHGLATSWQKSLKRKGSEFSLDTSMLLSSN